jgi:hypothetical protein
MTIHWPRARARGMTGPRADGQTPGGKHFRQGSRSDRPISGHGQGGRKCSLSGFGANVEGTKKAQKSPGQEYCGCLRRPSRPGPDPPPYQKEVTAVAARDVLRFPWCGQTRTCEPHLDALHSACLKTPYTPWSALSVGSGRSHEAPRVHHPARRHGGGVAAGGTRAAARDAGGRVSSGYFAQ